MAEVVLLTHSLFPALTYSILAYTNMHCWAATRPMIVACGQVCIIEIVPNQNQQGYQHCGVVFGKLSKVHAETEQGT